LINLNFESFVGIITAIAGATISGLFLLYVHHSKARQEIELQFKREQFQQKGKTYRELLEFVYAMYDYVRGLRHEIYWREFRDKQKDALLVASKEVVQLFNAVYLEFSKPSSSMSDQNLTKLIKDFINAIRRDLYEERPLPYTELKFVEPGTDTLEALALWVQYKSQLENIGIRKLCGLRSMNVMSVAKRTEIAKEHLLKLKHMAEREYRDD